MLGGHSYLLRMDTQIPSHKQTPSQPNLALDITRPTWIEISRNAFDHNVTTYRNLIVSPAKLFAVLKSNAYGHGLVQATQLVEHNPQVDGACVFMASDALLMRRLGFTKPIIVLGHSDVDLRDLIALDIQFTVHQPHHITPVQEAAAAVGKSALVHLKIETGLSRLGMYPEEALKSVDYSLAHNPNIKLAGLFSHYAESDAHDLAFTEQQTATFQELIQELTTRRVMDDVLVHLCNSTGVLRLPHAHNSMVRSGGGLWGIAKSDKIKAEARRRYPAFNLQPVMSWKTHIISLKWIEKGASVGYARTFVAQRRTLVAVAPVGYYDGYQRRLSNKGHVLVNRQVAKIIGRIGMNALMIDVTDLPETTYSSEIMLLGNHPLINAEYLADQMGTISYELLVGIQQHIPRFIV